jgi:hypothetical protein
MRMKSMLAVSLLALTILVAAGAASAGTNGHGHFRYRVLFSFHGQLTSTPSNGGVSINVIGGDRRALRRMLGQPVTQTFTYGASTEFLQWSHGKPAIVQPGDLSAGDYVWVRVRAPRWASLDYIEHKPAALVGDHGTQLFNPSLPLYLFRGTLESVSGTSLTVDIRGGNRHAMRLLIGQSRTETFSTGDNTIFLLWQGKVPTVISLSELKIGDPVIIRIRAPRDASLAQVEAAPARHVGDREPANA